MLLKEETEPLEGAKAYGILKPLMNSRTDDTGKGRISHFGTGRSPSKGRNKLNESAWLNYDRS
jgi:hypothetical protein